MSNLDLPTARLEVTDTGREIWAATLICIPLVVPQYSDFSRILSLFEIIKRHHIDTFDADTAYTSGQKKVEAFDASDILAHKGFQFKANAANGGDTYTSRLFVPYEIGSSTTYGGNLNIGYNTSGPRILKNVAAPTNTASYLTWVQQHTPEYQLLHQSPSSWKLPIPEIYDTNCTGANFIGCRFEVVKNVTICAMLQDR